MAYYDSDSSTTATCMHRSTPMKPELTLTCFHRFHRLRCIIGCWVIIFSPAFFFNFSTLNSAWVCWLDVSEFFKLCQLLLKQERGLPVGRASGGHPYWHRVLLCKRRGGCRCPEWHLERRERCLSDSQTVVVMWDEEVTFFFRHAVKNGVKL